MHWDLNWHHILVRALWFYGAVFGLMFLLGLNVYWEDLRWFIHVDVPFWFWHKLGRCPTCHVKQPGNPDDRTCINPDCVHFEGVGPLVKSVDPR